MRPPLLLRSIAAYLCSPLCRTQASRHTQISHRASDLLAMEEDDEDDSQGSLYEPPTTSHCHPSDSSYTPQNTNRNRVRPDRVRPAPLALAAHMLTFTCSARTTELLALDAASDVSDSEDDDEAEPPEPKLSPAEPKLRLQIDAANKLAYLPEKPVCAFFSRSPPPDVVLTASCEQWALHGTRPATRAHPMGLAEPARVAHRVVVSPPSRPLAFGPSDHPLAFPPLTAGLGREGGPRASPRAPTDRKSVV